MLSKSQIQLIHIAKHQAGLTDDAYRTVLRSVGGVESSKELNQADYERVLAVLEQHGFVDAKNGAGYWQRKAEYAELFANVRLVRKIEQLAATPGQRYGTRMVLRDGKSKCLINCEQNRATKKEHNEQAF
ncbi:MAG TPA: phage protein GemA/Gp16 family protein [Tepidisphaeraceae bacterium]|jgi:hypothetical protein